MTSSNPINKITLMHATLAALIVGLILWIVRQEVNLLLMLGVFNLVWIVKWCKTMPDITVMDPVKYVTFNDGHIQFGSTSIPAHKVTRVALETTSEHCYFSLPYNPTTPGNPPGFVFPARKAAEFRCYLQAELGNIHFIH
ncbi:hypothetical protein EXU34_01335 [Alteromonas sp. ZYF713]|nr:hypothetical protein [Alteromonas sp. ZYF713]